jgi:hypothetical protein
MRNLIKKVENQMEGNQWLKALLVGIAGQLLIGRFLDDESRWTVFIKAIPYGLALWYFIPLKNRKEKALSFLHGYLPQAEYSLDLLEKEEWNVAEQLQVERLEEQLKGQKLPNLLFRDLWKYLLLVVFIWATTIIKIKIENKKELTTQAAEEEKREIAPSFSQLRVNVNPPAYTGISATHSGDGNISTIVGSQVEWAVRMSKSDEVQVYLHNGRGEDLAFSKSGEVFSYKDKVVSTGIYGLKAVWKDSVIWQSDYYKIESIPDHAPKIEPSTKELYQFHSLNDPKDLKLEAKISDDFAVTQVYLVATLARGSGENVKFREVRFPVSNERFKSKVLTKQLSLTELNFTPGDELYYYWAAIDNKSPQPNFSKSDTYFIVYKDTSAKNQTDIATMAVNILPEYFRSQRQIIIDTERLIAQRKKLKAADFNATSNEIGFDQKALRIRYGQYLGEEYETNIGGHVEDSDDPLEGFVHKHDSEDEHHHEHVKPAHKAEASASTDPLAELLEAYVHSHDDAEANTFYEASTRSLLKTAMENMWQSELHLRLYEPEKALPYEYKALEFLKEAQHKARTFIAKTAYDPPPIKEGELRMKGELKKFNDHFKKELSLNQTQVKDLCARVIGFLNAYPQWGKKEKEEVAHLTTALSPTVVQAGLDKWKVIRLLQNSLNDSTLNAEDLRYLKSSLKELASGKSEGSVPLKPTNKSLEKAFWNHYL